MSVSGVAQSFASIVGAAGRALIHTQWPDEFEYYLMTLELVEDEVTIETLSFPVMPNSITISNTTTKSITRTSYGVVSLENPSFNPLDIRISGSFGRRMRYIANRDGTKATLLGVASSVAKATFPGISAAAGLLQKREEFDKNIKTGYGVSKIMENMMLKASSLSESGKPYMLFLYNFAFNSHYLVEVVNFEFSQDLSSNMMWNYNVSFRAVAPADSISGMLIKRTSQRLNADVLQKGVNNIIKFTSSQKGILKNKLLEKIEG